MTKVDMASEVARLQAENEALKAKAAKANTLSFKVSEKGALSVYGMGRFPVTLYAEQWERIFAAMPEIQAFMKVNAGRFSRKD